MSKFFKQMEVSEDHVYMFIWISFSFPEKIHLELETTGN